MELTVRSIGNSAGLVLPKEILSHLRVKKGDKLYLTEQSDGGYKLSPYDKSFADQLSLAEEIMREDRDVLRALAK